VLPQLVLLPAIKQWRRLQILQQLEMSGLVIGGFDQHLAILPESSQQTAA
jgi:hypothetical protein